MKAFLILSFSLAMFAGCSTAHCRKQDASSAKNQEASSGKATAETVQPTASQPTAPKSLPAGGNVAVKPSDRVRVFKYDGSLQCNQGKAIPVAEMQKELKDIHVFGSENRRDSLMRIQQCGTPTGQANVYEIDRKDLDKAKSLGFQIWTFE